MPKLKKYVTAKPTRCLCFSVYSFPPYSCVYGSKLKVRMLLSNYGAQSRWGRSPETGRTARRASAAPFHGGRTCHLVRLFLVWVDAYLSWALLERCNLGFLTCPLTPPTCLTLLGTALLPAETVLLWLCYCHQCERCIHSPSIYRTFTLH